MFQVFSTIFAVEAGMKIIALGFITYIRDGWNAFDFFIVTLSFVEMLMEGVKGLSVLRTFRLVSTPTNTGLLALNSLGAKFQTTFVVCFFLF